jgi:hypothetical protein
MAIAERITVEMLRMSMHDGEVDLLNDFAIASLKAVVRGRD